MLFRIITEFQKKKKSYFHKMNANASDLCESAEFWRRGLEKLSLVVVIKFPFLMLKATHNYFLIKDTDDIYHIQWLNY